MVPVVPSTDYIGIFHTKWSIVASETGLSEVEVGLSATIGPNPSQRRRPGEYELVRIFLNINTARCRVVGFKEDAT